MNHADRADPFSATSSAAFYVARDAAETALEGVEWALRAGRRTLALTGPPGIGKTTLLRVLTRRLRGDFRTVYAPYAALPADELYAWVLGLLDEKSEGQPEADLLALARRIAGEGAGLVLMIDDANSMPVPTARRLAKLVAKAEGTLRLLVVGLDDERAGRVISALGPVIEEVRLDRPLTGEEAEHYVQMRLERAKAPASVCERFDPETVSALHRRSGGVPQVLNVLASEVVRRSEADAAGLPSAPPLLPGLAPQGEADRIREEIEPWYDDAAEEETGGSWREPVFRQPRSTLEAPPGLLAVFGVALLAALGAVALPWLRGWVMAPPLPEAAETRPAPALPETPLEALAPQRPVAPAPAPVAVPVREPVSQPALPERVAPPTPPLAVPAPAVRPPPAPAPVVEASPPAPRVGATRPAARSEAAASPVAEPPGVAPAREAPGVSPVRAAPVAPAAAPVATQPVSVNINATPWALIQVDEVSFGETPLAGVRLLPGRHTLRAELPDGRVLERVVDVRPDNRHFSFP